MTKISRSSFVERFSDKSLRVAELDNAATTSSVDAGRSDRNKDGLISGSAELQSLFRRLDHFDSDGSYNSMRLADDQGRPTRAGELLAAVDEMAREGLLPDTLSKDAFVGLLKDKMIPLGEPGQPSAADLRSADLNGDGILAGPTEAQRLFTNLDRSDRNGDANSVRRIDGESLTPVGAQIEALLGRRVDDVSGAWNARPTGRLGQAYKGYQSALADGVQLNASKVGVMTGAMNSVRRRWPLVQEVARRADLPPELVASIWYREDNAMRVDRYLHNGQRLGSTTTLVPKGIFFRRDQFVESAVHALNMKKSSKDALNLSFESHDVAAMAAFSERYNGFGYRAGGYASPYVTAGTNLYHRGLYVADGAFDRRAVDQRLGTLPLMQAIRTQLRGQDGITTAPR